MLGVSFGQDLNDASIHPCLAVGNLVNGLYQSRGGIGTQKNAGDAGTQRACAGGGLNLVRDREKRPVVASVAGRKNEVLPDVKIEQDMFPISKWRANVWTRGQSF